MEDFMAINPVKTLVSFYNPGKYQKIRGFLIFDDNSLLMFSDGGWGGQKGTSGRKWVKNFETY